MQCELMFAPPTPPFVSPVWDSQLTVVPPWSCIHKSTHSFSVQLLFYFIFFFFMWQHNSWAGCYPDYHTNKPELFGSEIWMQFWGLAPWGDSFLSFCFFLYLWNDDSVSLAFRAHLYRQGNVKGDPDIPLLHIGLIHTHTHTHPHTGRGKKADIWHWLFLASLCRRASRLWKGVWVWRQKLLYSNKGKCPLVRDFACGYGIERWESKSLRALFHR